jgi:hypothetical protein
MFLLRISVLLVLVAGWAGLLGCALQTASRLSPGGFSAEQCQDIEWQETGLRDGRAGDPYSSEFTRLVEGCAPFGTLESERAAYARGLEEGYVVYCHASNAERLGLAGEKFHETFCASGERESLIRAHKKGLARSGASSKPKR